MILSPTKHESRFQHSFLDIGFPHLLVTKDERAMIMLKGFNFQYCCLLNTLHYGSETELTEASGGTTP